MHKCYESLLRQTSDNFVWQIVDDGSTDNTKELVEGFIAENKMEIVYHRKENGGKVSAINYSFEITDTPLWVCLDSDDYLTDNAVEVIERHYPCIRDDESLCGLFGLRSAPDLKPMQGKEFPAGVVTATQFEVRHTYQIPPEYVQIYKTKVASQYKYPIFPGEKYVPLSYVQDQIDVKYRFHIIREATMVCEYLQDGITNNQKKLVKKYPKGYTAFKKQQIELAPNFMYKLKACITYDTGCILSKNKNWLKESPSKLLTLVCYPVAYLDYLLRYKNIKI